MLNNNTHINREHYNINRNILTHIIIFQQLTGHKDYESLQQSKEVFYKPLQDSIHSPIRETSERKR